MPHRGPLLTIMATKPFKRLKRGSQYLLTKLDCGLAVMFSVEMGKIERVFAGRWPELCNSELNSTPVIFHFTEY